jgi:hypothetical protein
LFEPATEGNNSDFPQRLYCIALLYHGKNLMLSASHRRFALLALAFALFVTTRTMAAQSSPEAILQPADAAKILPDSVFFRGQSAPIQKRNASGVRFADGMYLLTALVDNSGYSTGVREKYQATFITEVPLTIDGHPLPAGAYGVGFIAGNHFVVMDVGAHDLLTATSMHDEKLHRPRPLLILPADTTGAYRLCFGRDCVSFERAK